MIGGPQGSGIDTSSSIFGRACGYGGYHLYGKREYHSNIKGLHSYFHFRVSEQPVSANVSDVDLLAAFDAETVARHINEVIPNGGVILEKVDLKSRIIDIPTLPPEFLDEFRKNTESKAIDTINDLVEAAKKRKIQVYPVSFLDLLKEVANELNISKMSKVARMKNVLALGVTFSLLDYDFSLVERAIKATFGEKPKIADMNILACKKAYEYVKQKFKDGFSHKLEKLDAREERIFLTGFQAVALGKVLGGCRIQSYYPITPAADESEYLEAHEVFQQINGEGAILIMQAEDEIAAVNMASGAALAGARAATATSGPGFSLMVEGLSWAGNNEVPIVVSYYQRGAPSTGLPTRHGQDDLRFAVHAGHGEFPRMVLASGDMKECFFDAALAFNYAERFQTPVIHLIDKAIANTTQSYSIFDLSSVRINRGILVRNWDPKSNGEYLRFEFTDSGVSPRAFLGTKNAIMWYTGDEHNELGHISEEPSNRNRMMEKRMKKLETANKEISTNEKLNFFGSESAENVVVSWGSPKGAILEALEILAQEGFELAFLQVRLIQPFPEERVTEILKSKTRIAVEMNYSGQLASMISEKTGIFMDYYIVKYNGRPMTTTEVYESLKMILQGKATKRQVLTHGN